jgi:hypothetical protein
MVTNTYSYRFKRLLATVGLTAVLGAAAAAPASAWYQRYLGTAVFAPGSAATSASNSLTFNATSFVSGPTMGTKYGRSDGTSTTWLWSSTGSIFDGRTIAYGFAICEAAPGNSGSMVINFCDTGNG